MKKVLCAVLAAALACGLCGCNKDEGARSNAPISEPNVTGYENVSQSAESSAENSDETSAVVIKPEIEMDGQLISLPCKVKDIKGITIDREYSFGVVPATENVVEYSTAFFYYNGIRAGGIILEGDCSQKTVLDEETVIGISLKDEFPISYYGFTLKSDRMEIIKVLGEPDIGFDTGLNYFIDGNSENNVIFYFNSADKISEIGIYLRRKL